MSHITPFGMAKSVLLFDPTRAVTARALRLVQSQTSKRPLRLPEHGLARVEDRTQNVSRILQKGGLPTLLRFCASLSALFYLLFARALLRFPALRPHGH